MSSTAAHQKPTRIWKQFALELAEPVASFFNCFMSSGIFPTQWKDSLIAPLPKVMPIIGDGNLRPIALAPVISKVLEDFVVEWLILMTLSTLSIVSNLVA